MTSTESTPIEVNRWRDKKRYLWLMGLIAPTALFVMLPIVGAFNHAGWHVAAQVPFWIGPILLYILLPALDLLLAVGVPRDAAESDAEGIEHHVSEATLAAFARFLRSRA